MNFERKIALDCPYCKKTIFQPARWFKQAYFTCPHCQKGLAEGQFARLLADLEQAEDACIDALLQDSGKSGCCSKAGGCGKS
ncbi:hypothetical protein [Geoalkalibacter halelectricus]|uniref:Uncharacterized protein n=1 Tax=Geoalkalibacter halelectricus TaxID=2847045 RepID=A0ABY5ZQL9_9BACT|nr:hypothetical protein [Geoalkalibacter halelectricus]MDO3379143.1 hypothetical protein [Geoalkalibacter halelectricus]UWZ80903.1 hypothetical protein L9S41_05735 [Geoalkalibacter halelectricus]